MIRPPLPPLPPNPTPSDIRRHKEAERERNEDTMREVSVILALWIVSAFFAVALFLGWLAYAYSWNALRLVLICAVVFAVAVWFVAYQIRRRMP